MYLKLPLFRALALIALAGSVLSLVEAGREAPFFCGFQSGCGEVSAYGRIGPMPLGLVGLLFFLGFYLATLFPSSLPALGPMALLAGVAGIALLGLQVVVLQAFCRICLVVDAAAMLLAVVELAIPARPPVFTSRRWPWLAALAPALALPLALPLALDALRPGPAVPEEVKARRMPGKVNLFLVTNFQCAHCRTLHETLELVLAEHGDRVSLWMEPLPLPHQADARAAARLYWCARRSGRGSEMASSLFQSGDLSEARLDELAQRAGLKEVVDACLNEERLDRDIDAATAWLDRRAFRGLPILWIEDQVFSGHVKEATLRAALDQALDALQDR